MLARQIIIRVASGTVLLLGISLIVSGAFISAVPVIVAGFTAVILGPIILVGTMIPTRRA